MPKQTIFNQLFNGVDMQANPLALPEGKVAEAINIKFQDGTIKVRDGIEHHNLGVRGQVQGAVVYSPARGLSHKPFSSPKTSVAFAVGGEVYYSLVSADEFVPAAKICGEPLGECQAVHLYQAENYLIIQSPLGNTAWWEGKGCYVCSPGFGKCNGTAEERVTESLRLEKKLVGAEVDCCFEEITYCADQPVVGDEEDHDSHDTFIWEKHENFLINSAGLGIYAHGRIHQQGAYEIYVSDLIHKRGNKKTDDILLMEEQQNASMAPPLSTNSRLGQLRAMEVMQQQNTANGDGELIAYYDRGVVSFNTALPARETKHDAEGQKTREGWDTQRQVSHLLNGVSAVGRYAVYPLPRDHVFRSKRGLHFLGITLGEGSFRDEFINTFSQPVQPVLDADASHALIGTTVAQWEDNHRIAASAGFRFMDYISPFPVGRGLVMWNQATRFTQDRTPESTWEGVWCMDSNMAGFHKLMNVADTTSKTIFGSLTSDAQANVYFSEFVDGKTTDTRDGENLPIEWSITSGQLPLGSLSKTKEISGGRLEVKVKPNTRVRVMFRTDENAEWSEWCEESPSVGSLSICNLDLGALPSQWREGTWFQFRVEGIGYAEILDFEIEFSEKSTKINKNIPCKEFVEDKDSFFTFADKPSYNRWKD